MKVSSNGPRGTTGFLRGSCVLGLMMSMQLHAAPATEDASDDWAWAATVYLWLPSLGGETAFPSDNGGQPIDVDMSKVLDSLNFAFMGALDGRKGRWGVGTDLIYLDLSASKKASRGFNIGGLDKLPVNVSAKVDLGLTGWLWTLTGNYAVIEHDNYTMRALAGARALDLAETVDWELTGDVAALPPQERSGSGRASDTQWDAIVGVKGRATIGAEKNWYVPYYFDIGAGESDLTWQGMAGVGYSFDTIDVVGVWRYLDYDLGRSVPIQSINFNGPALGVTFRF